DSVRRRLPRAGDLAAVPREAAVIVRGVPELRVDAFEAQPISDQRSAEGSGEPALERVLPGDDRSGEQETEHSALLAGLLGYIPLAGQHVLIRGRRTFAAQLGVEQRDVAA